MSKTRRKKPRDPVSAIKPGTDSARVRVAGESMTVLERRCGYMGWASGAGSLRRAKSPLLGTFLGQLRYTRMLSETAYLGIEAYIGTVARYRAAIGLPVTTAQAQSLGASISGSGVIPDDGTVADKARRATTAYMRVTGALQAAQADLSVVRHLTEPMEAADTFAWAVDTFGPERIVEAERIGRILSRHFQLPDYDEKERDGAENA